ncbi:hypothetical protein ABIA33_007593 [Streptacidiphilus sp. MAP12-16]|uniref:RICIN domain-containing protein n=1 Tax=Streptacidiphilus sp. MAP12-16 TaxID=3156300 RepID=UPI003517F5D1
MTESQQWQLHIVNGKWWFINCDTGLTLEVMQSTLVNSGKVDQWPYNGTATQFWTYG